MPGSGFKLLDAYVEVHGDGTGVVDEVAGHVANDGGKAKASGEGFGKKLVAGIAGSIAVAKIGQFLSESISEGSDLNETMSAASAIFGDNAAEMTSWSQNAAKTLGLSKGAALEAATGFGDMMHQIGFSGTEAAGQSKHIVQMAADLGSFKNLGTNEVLDMISGSLRGEFDSLQRVIPNINAARVEKEALTETGKTLASSLTAQEKAQATLNIINADGATAMGDFAKTADGVANSQKIAAAQTEDLKASLGTSLLPVVQTLLGVVTTSLLPALQGFTTWITSNKGYIVPFAVVLGILALAFVGITVATWAMNTALLANPITWIVIGIVALIAAVVLLIANWGAVVDFLQSAWAGFLVWFGGVMDGFIGWWNGLWAGFAGMIADAVNGMIDQTMGAMSSFLAWWNGLWAGFGGMVADGVNAALAWFVSLPAMLLALLAGAGSWLLDIGRDILVGLATGIAAYFIFIAYMFTKFPSDLVGWLVGAATWLITTGSDILNGLGAGIAAGYVAVVAWVTALPGRILAMLVTAATWLVATGSSILAGLWLGITTGYLAVSAWFVALPGLIWAILVTAATWLVATGSSILGGLASGIVTGYVAVSGWFGALPGRIWGFVSGAGSWILGAGSNLIDGLLTGARNGWSGFMGFLRGIPGAVGGFFGGAGSWLWSAGRDLINGLLNGIRSLAGTIGSFFLGLLPGWIVGPFKAAMGIHSPSTLFYGFGENTVDGYLNAVNDKKGDIADTMSDLVSVPTLGDVSGALSVGPRIADVVGSLGADSSATAASAAAGARQTIIQIEKIVLEAKDLDTVQKMIAMLQELAQVARQGRGVSAGIG